MREAASQYLKWRSREYKTAKQAQRLRNQLDIYVLPYIGEMLIEDTEQYYLVEMLANFFSLWRWKGGLLTRLQIKFFGLMAIKGCGISTEKQGSHTTSEVLVKQ